MDDQQRARGLLCQFCDLDRSDYYDGLRVNAGEAVEAIAAALRAAPEGFVMVPVEPTEEMIVRATWEEVGGHCHSCTAWPASHSDARRVWAAMLAARPQG